MALVDQVYLAVHLLTNTVEETALVISMGERSFTVNVPRLGITERLFLDKMPDIVGELDEAEGCLYLKSTSSAQHTWTIVGLKILSKIIVRCTVAAKEGPVQVRLEFVRPYMDSPTLPITVSQTDK